MGVSVPVSPRFTLRKGWLDEEAILFIMANIVLRLHIHTNAPNAEAGMEQSALTKLRTKAKGVYKYTLMEREWSQSELLNTAIVHDYSTRDLHITVPFRLEIVQYVIDFVRCAEPRTASFPKPIKDFRAKQWEAEWVHGIDPKDMPRVLFVCQKLMVSSAIELLSAYVGAQVNLMKNPQEVLNKWGPSEWSASDAEGEEELLVPPQMNRLAYI